MKTFKIFLITIVLGLIFIPVTGQSIYDLGVQGTNYDIAKDNNGNVHLVWVNSDNYKKLYYSKIVNNSLSGIESVTLTYKVHVRFTRPRMAVQPNGSTVHVTYISPGPGSYVIDLWRNSSGIWSEDVVWSKGTSKYYMAFPAVGVDASGNVHIIAQRWFNETQNYVAYWRKPAGGSWPGYVSVESDNTVPWRDLSMFTDSSGGVHATWKTGGHSYGRYRYAASGASLANSTTINIPLAAGGNMVSFGDTFATENGDVHHVYMRYADETLWHTVKRSGSNSFGELSMAGVVNNCEQCGTYNYENPWPAIGVGPDGTPVIAWAENRKAGVVNYVNVAYKDATAGWIPTVVDNTAQIDGEGRPVIAVVGTTGYMVWRAGNGNLKLMVYTLSGGTGVLSPNGGESWNCGSTYDITWNLENATGNVDINLYKNGVNLGPIVSDITNSGSYSWTITALEDLTKIDLGDDYQIEVAARDDSDSDMSDNYFSITSSISVLSPVAGDKWFKGSSYDITWTNSSCMSAGIKINIFKDSFSADNFVTQLTGPNTGVMNWTVPTSFASGNYLMRVKTDDDLVYGDSGLFSIATPTLTITVTSPKSGDDWKKGSTYDVLWTKSGTQSANVKINIFKNSTDPANFVEQLTGPNSGSYSWTIPGTYTTGNYILRIKTDDNAIYDDSDVFQISDGTTVTPTITVTSPKSGDDWKKGSTYDILWTKSGTQSANVKINIFKNSVDLANFVEQLTGPNSGTYSWAIPGTYTSGNYILRVKTDDNLVYDDSDVFQISDGTTVTPAITVISPNQCSTWDKTMTFTITWEKQGTMSSNVKVNIFKNSVDPANFVEQLTGPNTGSISWTIPGTYAVGNYILRVKTDDSAVYGDSELFSVTNSVPNPPSITVTSPNACDTFTKLKTYLITWTKNGTMSSNVKVNIFKNSVDPANFVEQLTGSNTGSISWTIPGTYAVGNYILRVKTDDNSVYGDSTVFQIID